jgi:hypothetical protein
MTSKPTTTPTAPSPAAAVAKAAHVRKIANELVNTFIPETDFVGKPFGPNGGEMHFRAGVPSSPVPQSFIDSLSAKKTGDKPAADHG